VSAAAAGVRRRVQRDAAAELRVRVRVLHGQLPGAAQPGCRADDRLRAR